MQIQLYYKVFNLFYFIIRGCKNWIDEKLIAIIWSD